MAIRLVLASSDGPVVGMKAPYGPISTVRVDLDGGEAVLVPSERFWRCSSLMRADLLQDIIDGAQGLLDQLPGMGFSDQNGEVIEFPKGERDA